MLKRVTLAGFGTGIVAAAALFYPLYVVLPSDIVPGWQAGSAQIAGLLVALTALIVAVGGGLAAWWQGDGQAGRRVVIGALAGTLAGFTTYGLLGAAASGVLASGVMFIETLDEATFVGYLANSMISTVWSVHVAFWGMALTGALLGGIGGLLAPARSSADASGTSADDVVLANITAIAAMLASSLCLVVIIAIFTLLPGSLRDAAQENGVGLLLPPETVFFWPTATMMALFVASHAAATATLRAVARRGEGSRSLLANSISSAVLSMLLPVGLLILELLITPNTILAPAFFPGMAISLIIAVTQIPLTRKLLAQVRKAPVVEADRPMPMLRRNLLPVVLGSTLGIGIPGVGTVIPVALNLVLIHVVQVGEFYDPSTATASSPVSIINSVYQMQAGAFGGMIVGSAVFSLVGTGLLILIARLLTRQPTNAGEAE